jgi:hypothetical protein
MDITDLSAELTRHVRSVAHATFTRNRDGLHQVVHVERQAEMIISQPPAALERAISNLVGEDGGIILRVALDRLDPVAKVPQHELRGYSIVAGEWFPVPCDELFSAINTDAVTGEPLSPEPGVILAADTADTNGESSNISDDSPAITARASAQLIWQTIANGYGLAETVSSAPSDWSPDSANQLLAKMWKAQMIATVEGGPISEVGAFAAESVIATIDDWDIEAEIIAGIFNGVWPADDVGDESFLDPQLLSETFPEPESVVISQEAVDHLSPERQAQLHELTAGEEALIERCDADDDKVRHQAQLALTWLEWQRTRFLFAEQLLWSQDPDKDQQLLGELATESETAVDQERRPAREQANQRDALTIAELARMAYNELAACQRTIVAAQYDLWSEHYPDRLFQQYQEVDVVQLSWSLPAGQVYFDFEDRDDWPSPLIVINDPLLDENGEDFFEIDEDVDDIFLDDFYLHGVVYERGPDYLAMRPVISWFDECNPTAYNPELLRLPLPMLVIASPEVAARFSYALRVDPLTGDISSDFPDCPDEVFTRIELLCSLAKSVLDEMTDTLQGYHLRKLASQAHPQGSKKGRKKRRKR